MYCYNSRFGYCSKIERNVGIFYGQGVCAQEVWEFKSAPHINENDIKYFLRKAFDIYQLRK